MLPPLLFCLNQSFSRLALDDRLPEGVPPESFTLSSMSKLTGDSSRFSLTEPSESAYQKSELKGEKGEMKEFLRKL